MSFVGINLFLQPQEYDTLYTRRMMLIDLIMTLVLLGLMLLFYLMFYLMARGLSRGMRLAHENEILQMQAAQYRGLQKNIEEIRQARHDLRHHFVALQGCMESGDFQAAANYISAHMKTMSPDTPQAYCRNPAVNGVLCHYRELALQQGTELSLAVQMEEHPMIPEPELCTLLGNLLENALEACAGLKENRSIQVRIRQEGRAMLAITVDNPCPQPPRWESGKLCSSKHKGLGFGTQSVQIIAEHYHGDARFEWRDGIFQASVLLNP